jgi:hypothetical protein
MPCGATAQLADFAGGETIWELADTLPAISEASVRCRSGRRVDGDMSGSRYGTILQSADANLGMAGCREGA